MPNLSLPLSLCVSATRKCDQTLLFQSQIVFLCSLFIAKVDVDDLATGHAQLGSKLLSASRGSEKKNVDGSFSSVVRQCHPKGIMASETRAYL